MKDNLRYDRTFSSAGCRCNSTSCLSTAVRQLVTILIVFLQLATSQQISDVINTARCRVRCLSQLKSSVEPSLLGVGLKDSVSLMSCLRHSDCTACIKPCNQQITATESCEEVCSLPQREDHTCLESCRFLQQIKSIHSGQCSFFHTGPASSQTGHSVPCGRACRSDADCDSRLKCCVNQCGKTCVTPALHDQLELLPVPDMPIIREKLKGGSIELRWNAVSNSSTPLLYIVDSRWNVGKQPAEEEMTPWQQVAQTSSTSAVINDFTPGHWYQFRVSAVNVHGTSGGSEATPAFTLSKEPRRPGPPTNLTEGDTLIMGGKMAVTLHWFPPSKSDLPVSRYKLFWSKRQKASAQHSTPAREYRQVLQGHRLVFQIPNLESATTYFVQIQAICHYGDVRLKSEKTGIYITTYPVPQASDHESGSSGGGGGGGGGRSLPIPSPVLNLTAQQPFYQDGVLKTNISWSHGGETAEGKTVIHWTPEACIADNTLADDLSKGLSSATKETSFLIYDLRPDCRYLVKVEAVSSRGVLGESAQVSLSTPSCGQALIVDSQQPDCLSNVPSVPDEPEDLVHSFIISTANMTSRISWSSPDSDTPITGYRVVWGQLLHVHQSSPTMDKSTAITKVLPKHVHILNIGDLKEGTTYLVRVQALSRIGAGRIATIQFTTPLLQVKPVDQDLGAYSDNNRRSDASKRKQDQGLATSPLSYDAYVQRDRITTGYQNMKLTSSSSSSSFYCSLLTVSTHLVFVFLLKTQTHSDCTAFN